MKQINGVINYVNIQCKLIMLKLIKQGSKTNKLYPNNKYNKKSHKHSNLNPFKNPQCPLQTLY